MGTDTIENTEAPERSKAEARAHRTEVMLEAALMVAKDGINVGTIMSPLQHLANAIVAYNTTHPIEEMMAARDVQGLYARAHLSANLMRLYDVMMAAESALHRAVTVINTIQIDRMEEANPDE
jgi:hypothetical protein